MGKRQPTVTPYPTEHDEQCHVVAWARRMAVLESRLRLLRAGMEGVRLTIGQRVKCKRAGMESAWPDLFLSVPAFERGGVRRLHGLYIELKRVKVGVVSPEQKAMHALLRDQGYQVEVCRGAAEAINVICDYLRFDDGARRCACDQTEDY